MSMYGEDVLDHYRNPRNSGELEDADVHVEQSNGSCGDSMELFLELEEDEIERARFTGDGCAVSQAAASMVVERLEGMAVEEALALDLDDIGEMFGSDVREGRESCVSLVLDAINEGLSEK